MVDRENPDVAQQILLVVNELSVLEESFSFNCQKGFVPNLSNISKCLDEGLSLLNEQIVTLNSTISQSNKLLQNIATSMAVIAISAVLLLTVWIF